MSQLFVTRLWLFFLCCCDLYWPDGKTTKEEVFQSKEKAWWKNGSSWTTPFTLCKTQSGDSNDFCNCNVSSHGWGGDEQRSLESLTRKQPVDEKTISSPRIRDRTRETTIPERIETSLEGHKSGLVSWRKKIQAWWTDQSRIWGRVLTNWNSFTTCNVNNPKLSPNFAQGSWGFGGFWCFADKRSQWEREPWDLRCFCERKQTQWAGYHWIFRKWPPPNCESLPWPKLHHRAGQPPHPPRKQRKTWKSPKIERCAFVLESPEFARLKSHWEMLGHYFVLVDASRDGVGCWCWWKTEIFHNLWSLVWIVCSSDDTESLQKDFWRCRKRVGGMATRTKPLNKKEEQVLFHTQKFCSSFFFFILWMFSKTHHKKNSSFLVSKSTWQNLIGEHFCGRGFCFSRHFEKSDENLWCYSIISNFLKWQWKPKFQCDSYKKMEVQRSPPVGSVVNVPTTSPPSHENQIAQWFAHAGNQHEIEGILSKITIPYREEVYQSFLTEFKKPIQIPHLPYPQFTDPQKLFVTSPGFIPLILFSHQLFWKIHK